MVSIRGIKCCWNLEEELIVIGWSYRKGYCGVSVMKWFGNEII